MRNARLAVLVLAAVLAASPAASAAPSERDLAERGSAWSALLERLEPLLTLVLPQMPGPDADPNGITAPPPAEVEGDVGPDADPNG